MYKLGIFRYRSSQFNVFLQHKVALGFLLLSFMLTTYFSTLQVKMSEILSNIYLLICKVFRQAFHFFFFFNYRSKTSEFKRKRFYSIFSKTKRYFTKLTTQQFVSQPKTLFFFEFLTRKPCKLVARKFIYSYVTCDITRPARRSRKWKVYYRLCFKTNLRKLQKVMYLCCFHIVRKFLRPPGKSGRNQRYHSLCCMQSLLWACRSFCGQDVCFKQITSYVLLVILVCLVHV